VRIRGATTFAFLLLAFLVAPAAYA